MTTTISKPTNGRFSVRRSVLGLFLAGLAAVGSAVHAQSAPDESDRLSGAAIRQLLTGNSITGETREGPFTAHAPSYGVIKGLRSYNYRDQGNWRVTDDELCVQWENWWSTKERCWNVYLVDETVTWIEPGGELSAARFVRGNPDGL